MQRRMKSRQLRGKDGVRPLHEASHQEERESVRKDPKKRTSAQGLQQVLILELQDRHICGETQKAEDQTGDTNAAQLTRDVEILI